MSLRIFKRGQIWWVDLDPTVGSEIQKPRPCVIVSSDAIRKLPVRIVVPLTGSTPSKNSLFHVPIEINDAISLDGLAGLTKDSVANILQIRCVSDERFKEYLAEMSADKMEEITHAIANIVEFECNLEHCGRALGKECSYSTGDHAA